MKKVLIIANLFHASPRIPGLCAYLSEFNWQPFIITPPLEENDKKRLGLTQKFLEATTIINAPYKGDILWPIRKLFKKAGLKKEKSFTEQLKEKTGSSFKKSLIDRLLFLYQAIFGFPDTEKTWFNPALKAAKMAFGKYNFDAIISTSPYPTSHFVAKRLKEENKIPWLADFRDPWSENRIYPYGKIRKFFDTRLEKKTLKQADVITVISNEDLLAAKNLHKKKAIYSIPNGFDPELINALPISLTKKFTITYTGRIYVGKQDPLKILRAIRQLINTKEISPNDIEIRFYGPKYKWFENEIKKQNLKNVVHQYGILSRSEIIQKQRESHLLLLLGWEKEGEFGVFTSKVFEYFAARRPIFITGGSYQEEIKRIITDLNAGFIAVTPQKITEVLLPLYKTYKNGNLLTYNGDLKKIDQYSYNGMTKKFAGILNKIIEYNE